MSFRAFFWRRALVCASAALVVPAPDVWAHETVVVAPARMPRTASAWHADPQELAALPKKSAEDLLRTVPGLLVTRHGAEGKGVQFLIRGFDAVHGSDLEVLLEGVPLNELSNVHGQGYLDLGFLIPEVVGGMDLSPGAFEVDQGNFATAGTLRLSLGVAETGTRVGYQFGTSGRHRGLALFAPKPDAFVALEVLSDRGFGENRDTARVASVGRASLWNSDRARLGVFAAAVASRFGEPGVVPLEDVEAGRLGFYDVYAWDEEGESLRALLALVHDWSMGDLGSLRTVAWGSARRLMLEENFTGFLLYPERGDERVQRHRAGGGGVRSEWGRPFLRGGRLFAGASATLEQFNQSEDAVDTEDVPWQRNLSLRAWQSTFGLWAGARVRPLPWLRLEGGGRLDAFGFEVEDAWHGRAQLSPRLSASVNPGGPVTLFAAYGHGLRAPMAGAFVTRSFAPVEEARRNRAGTPEIARAEETELGARFLPTDWLELRGSAFGIWLDREQIFDHVAAVLLERNATRRLGVELAAVVQPLPWIHVRMDGTWVDARFPGSGDPVPGAPTLMGQLTATALHESGVSAGARVLALGARPLAHGAKAEPVIVADARVAYRWRWIEGSLEVENLAGTEWREGEYHFASWWDRSTPRSSLPRLHYAAGSPRLFRLGVTFFL